MNVKTSRERELYKSNAYIAVRKFFIIKKMSIDYDIYHDISINLNRYLLIYGNMILLISVFRQLHMLNWYMVSKRAKRLKKTDWL